MVYKQLVGHGLLPNKLKPPRVAISRFMKRSGKLWIRIFPHMGYTKKPLEVRMGGGKVHLKDL